MSKVTAKMILAQVLLGLDDKPVCVWCSCGDAKTKLDEIHGAGLSTHELSREVSRFLMTGSFDTSYESDKPTHEAREALEAVGTPRQCGEISAADAKQFLVAALGRLSC
jgi:hypothetical protein